MQRAAVLIGVSKSGNLPHLKAAIPNVRAMERWALDQGMDRGLVKVFTDEQGSVEPGPVKTAVKELVDLASIEQLVVYFSGHGVNLRYSEYWLLTNAPADTQAAINVASSAVLAGYSNIPHVLFFSDACRTAAEGIQAQFVTGSEIFPNTYSGGLEKPVDIFYSCTLGRPAYEIKDPTESAAAFKAVYTEALLAALTGKRVDIIVPEKPPPGVLPGAAQEAYGLICPRPLKDHLHTEVIDALLAANVERGVYQEPDARITSADGAWVSRLPLAPPASAGAEPPTEAAPPPEPTGTAPQPPETTLPAPRRPAPLPRPAPTPRERRTAPPGAPGPSAPSRRRAPAGRGRSAAPAPPTPAASAASLQNASAAVLHQMLQADAGLEAAMPELQGAVPGGAVMEELIRTTAQPFGPDHYETQCGFKIRGARCTAAFAARYFLELLPPAGEAGTGTAEAADNAGPGQLIRVHAGTNVRGDGDPPVADNVLLTFDNGISALLPALPDFLATVSFAGGELTDVAYEPSANSSRWQQYQDRAAELRHLRSVVSSAANLGVFKLEGEDAPMLAQRMQVAKGLDPSMALYAAYAYHDQQNMGRIEEMNSYLSNDLGCSLFDVAMLARRLSPGVPAAGLRPEAVPFIPLLSPGWSLLGAFGIQLPGPLVGLSRNLRPSLWTAFDDDGADMLRTYLESGG